MTRQKEAHPRNVPGPFYVVNGCCTTCGVPEMAPGIFEFAPEGHCYVKRQPSTPEGVELALRVMRTQELGCIRYAGSDPTILRRLAEADEAEQCDVELPWPLRAVLRKHVSFRVNPGSPEQSPGTVLEKLCQDLLEKIGARARATEVRVGDTGARFAIAWFEEDFHEIDLHALAGETRAFHLCHSGPIGLSEILDDVLRAGRYDEIVWSTSTSRENSAPHPW